MPVGRWRRRRHEPEKKKKKYMDSIERGWRPATVAEKR